MSKDGVNWWWGEAVVKYAVVEVGVVVHDGGCGGSEGG